MILSSVLLLIFGTVLAARLYRSEIRSAYAVIEQKNRTLNALIEGYFTEIANTIGVLASTKAIQEAGSLDPDAREAVLELYGSFADANKNITYIYSGYRNGLLLINDYTPPEGYDPTDRPWYQSALAAMPDISIGLPYQEIIDKEWLISTSRVLIDKNNEIRGVVTIDSSIDSIAEMLKQREREFESSHSFVTKANGEVIIHHNESYLGRPISEIVDSPIALDNSDGGFTYRLDNTQRIAFYSAIEETGWIIVTVVERQEITRPIMAQILLHLVIAAVIAVLFVIFQSSSLSKHFSNPLTELQKQVKAIIDGLWDKSIPYDYPNNEIGAIAREVGQLAEQELHVKNTLLEQKNEELEILSVTDQLTGLYNRHKIDVELEKEYARWVRYGRAFSIIIFDIDWFKRINDNYGHLTGDEVLKAIAQLLRENIRPTDIPGRWGGEEFLIVCPETDIVGARNLGVKLCSMVADHPFEIDTTVTISVGGSEFSKEDTLEDLIRRADEKLYEAKRRGKNTVVM